jgi:hypothetical protein
VVDPPPRRRQAGLAVGGSPLSLCITSISVIAKTLANPLSGDDLCVWKNVRSVICEVAEDGQGRVKFTELVSIIDAYSNAGHQIVTARKSSKIASNGNKPADGYVHTFAGQQQDSAIQIAKTFLFKRELKLLFDQIIRNCSDHNRAYDHFCCCGDVLCGGVTSIFYHETYLSTHSGITKSQRNVSRHLVSRDADPRAVLSTISFHGGLVSEDGNYRGYNRNGEGEKVESKSPAGNPVLNKPITSFGSLVIDIFGAPVCYMADSIKGRW